MSRVIEKLNAFSGELDTELRNIDRKLRELKNQKQVLTKLKVALKSTTPRKKKPQVKEMQPAGGNA